MVNVTMRADNVVDCGRTDLCLDEAAKETTGRRAERLRRAHATVEHDEPAARIQEQHVLLEDKIVSRQEVVGECLGQFLLGRAFQRSGWLSQRQRPVGDHGCLKLADHEAIEIRDLDGDDWGTGLAGWNAKASGRSKSDGRRAKKHSASGDRRVGHMHFLPGWLLSHDCMSSEYFGLPLMLIKYFAARNQRDLPVADFRGALHVLRRLVGVAVERRSLSPFSNNSTADGARDPQPAFLL